MWLQLAQLGVAAYGAISGRKDAKKAAKNAQALEERSIALEEKQYQDWHDMFGDLGQNLGDYYEKLTPENMTAQGLEAYELEKNRALTSLRQTIDQRGLGTSGLSKELETRVALTSAEDRAQIRAEAPMKTAQVKSNFLALGLNSNPMSQISQNANSRASGAAEAAAEARAASTKATGDAVIAGAEFLEGIFATKSAGS